MLVKLNEQTKNKTWAVRRNAQHTERTGYQQQRMVKNIKKKWSTYRFHNEKERNSPQYSNVTD
jgi:hypothetical protein